MKPSRHDTGSPKSRGRPKGTAVFAEEDLKALARFAELAVKAPGSKLAPFLKSKGYIEEKDTRRVQARWRSEKQRLLLEARIRLDSEPNLSIIELAKYFEELVKGLGHTVGPVLDKFADSFERARRYKHALDQLGREQDIPFDLENAEEVERAIQRYEPALLQTEEVRHRRLGALRTDELPRSLQFYVAAILLHDHSLQLAESELQEKQGKSDTKAKGSLT